MTWLDLANMLFDKSKALSPRGAHLHLDTAGWLRTWTPHQNQIADSAARHFCKYMDWPSLEQDAASLLYFRCLYAIESCIDAHSKGLKSPGGHERQQQTLESLLITAWHREGIEWAERRYGSKGSRLPACV